MGRIKSIPPIFVHSETKTKGENNLYNNIYYSSFPIDMVCGYFSNIYEEKSLIAQNSRLVFLFSLFLY